MGDHQGGPATGLMSTPPAAGDGSCRSPPPPDPPRPTFLYPPRRPSLADRKVDRRQRPSRPMEGNHLHARALQHQLRTSRASPAGAKADLRSRTSTSTSSSLDDDPPFYMNDPFPTAPRSTGAVMSSDRLGTRPRPSYTKPDPLRSSHAILDPLESGSEDFRSVIDDLTVENRRLRRRLKTYEKLHCSHLQREKLFEVWIHGLPPHKKRELENTLQVFASSLGEASPSEEMTSPTSHTRHLPVEQLPPHVDASPASTLDSPINDSAYASMSTSGRRSSAPGKRKTQRAQPKGPDRSNSDSACASMSTSGMNRAGPGPARPHSVRPTRPEDSKIRSYLHDIPAGLLPRHSPVMTEHLKKKLVVRKLERLFTGKAPSAGECSQPLQQQELSYSAAQAERSAVEASGKKLGAEGKREARIMMTEEPEMNLDPAAAVPCAPVLPSVPQGDPRPGPPSPSDLASSSSGSSPEQRPTRPMDLDPQRAQFPIENVDYIRHLGVTMPNPDQSRSTEDAEGWVYLNLLTNMAQLHTMNVTQEFTKRAVLEVSTKLELSRDGAKMRWRGGHTGTRMSSDSGSDADCQRSLDANGPGSEAAGGLSQWQDGTRGMLTMAEAARGTRRRRVLLGQANVENSFQYKPMFVHQGDSDEEDDQFLSDGESVTTPWARDDLVANGHSLSSTPSDYPGAKSSTLSTHKRQGGPIIFYNKAKFCTDLSGDPSIERLCGYDTESYTRFTTDVVGSEFPRLGATPQESTAESHDRPWYMSGLGSVDRSDLELAIAPESRSDAGSSVHMFSGAAPIDSGATAAPTLVFEVSGLGGVQPLDNFAITVHSRQVIAREEQANGDCHFDGRKPQVQSTLRSMPRPCPPASHDGSTEAQCPSTWAMSSKTNTVVRRQILSKTHSYLPPSTLPLPSCVLLPFSSSDDEDNDDTNSSFQDSLSNVSTLQVAGRPATGQPAPSPLTKVFSVDSSSHNQDGDASSAFSDSDDSSIDLLASARQIDPDTIAEREREFDQDTTAVFAPVDPRKGSSSAPPAEHSNLTSQSSTEDASQPASKADDQRDDKVFGSVSNIQRPSVKRSWSRNYSSESMDSLTVQRDGTSKIARIGI
ncbi:MAG: hypothetical protein M1837_003965 [Sclerophora amabilis]|nr:MAG: hypothetical protein M1837_003965 [Sclerophora amabilis]